MEICYYNTQIKEELDGAMSYIQRAIREKSDHSNWASLYLKMGLAELEHASTLVKIFEEDYRLTVAKTEGNLTYLSDIRRSILDMYTEYASRTKYLQQMFESM